MKRCANIFLAMIMLFTMTAMVSAAEPRNPGLSQYDIVKVTGVVKFGEDDYRSITETFPKQGGVASIALTTKYAYCADQPLTFTIYKYGN